MFSNSSSSEKGGGKSDGEWEAQVENILPQVS